MQTYPEWLADLEKLMADQSPPMTIDEVEPADLYAAYKAGAKVESVVRQLAAQPTPEPELKRKPAAIAAAPAQKPAEPDQTVGCLVLSIILVLIFIYYSSCRGPSNDKPEPPPPPTKEQLAAIEAGRIEDEIRKVEDDSRAKVQVPRSFEWRRDAFGYDSIKGTIHNGGKLPVSYWVVTVRFYDKAGKVVDSEYTNGAQPLYPGESKRWDIMHESRSTEKGCDAEVTEVRF